MAISYSWVNGQRARTETISFLAARRERKHDEHVLYFLIITLTSTDSYCSKVNDKRIHDKRVLYIINFFFFGKQKNTHKRDNKVLNFNINMHHIFYSKVLIYFLIIWPQLIATVQKRPKLTFSASVSICVQFLLLIFYFFFLLIAF